MKLLTIKTLPIKQEKKVFINNCRKLFHKNNILVGEE